MRKFATAIAVILTSAIIMLIPELIHTGFNLSEVDWQCAIIHSLIVDASVYVAFSYSNKTKNKKDKKEEENK